MEGHVGHLYKETTRWEAILDSNVNSIQEEGLLDNSVKS